MRTGPQAPSPSTDDATAMANEPVRDIMGEEMRKARRIAEGRPEMRGGLDQVPKNGASGGTSVTGHGFPNRGRGRGP